MWRSILDLILGAFGRAIAEVFRDLRRDGAIRDAGRAEATAEGERAARAIQQDVTDAISSQPSGRDDLVRRARAGSL